MYVRVFSAILDSSIWQEALHVRVLWLAMLIIADENRDGTVNVPISRLAQKAVLTVEETKAALDLLMAPDPESDSPEEDGRRIVPLVPDRPERGWRLVNWLKYKKIANAEERRQQVAENMRNYRSRKSGVISGDQPLPGSDPTVIPSEASSDSSSPTEESNTLFAVAHSNDSSKKKRPKEPKASARELVESFTLEEKHREWGKKNAPSVPIEAEIEAWKDRCRQAGYRNSGGSGGLISDAQASFYTAMRYAERKGIYRQPGQLFQQAPRVIKRAPMAGGEE